MNQDSQETTAGASGKVKESLHTPGPWHLKYGFADWNLPLQHEIYCCEHPQSDQDCVAIVLSVMPNPIGDSKNRDYANRQAANARLIAASPELLAACKRIEQDCLPAGDGILPTETFAQLRAAIAKAEVGAA